MNEYIYISYLVLSYSQSNLIIDKQKLIYISYFSVE